MHAGHGMACSAHWQKDLSLLGSYMEGVVDAFFFIYHLFICEMLCINLLFCMYRGSLREVNTNN